MRSLLLILISSVLLAQNPNSAVFPTTVATDSDLLAAKRSSTSTLSTSINSSTLTATVNDGTQFINFELVRIDSEEIKICSVSGNTLTICSGGRGFNTTTAAAHTTGTRVDGVISSYHVNQPNSELKAIEAWLRDYLNGCQDAGSNDTYACNLAPPITAYVTGGLYKFKANTSNTGAATVNFNGVGAKTIKKHSSSGLVDLSDNDIFAGDWVLVMYNGTVMQLMGTVGSGGGTWGTITGTLSSQTDLQSALNAKLSGVAWGIITGTLSSQTDLQAALDAKLTISTEQAGTPKYCRSTTGNDTYVCSVTPTLTAYTRGGCLVLDGDTANTGTATVNVNSLGAKSILNHAGSALSNSDIVANKPITICYDGTQFIIQGDGAGTSGGGTGVYCATTNSGNDLTCNPSPAVGSLTAGLVVTFSAPSGFLNSGAVTLNVSGLGAKPVYMYFLGGGVQSLFPGMLYSALPYTVLYGSADDAFLLLNESTPASAVISYGECPTSSSSSTVYSCAVSGYFRYASSQLIHFDVGTTSCTGGTATTLDVNSLGAKRIYRTDGTSDPLASECVANAKLLLLYDTTLTSGAGGWRILAGHPYNISVGAGLSSSTDPVTGEQTVAVDGTGQTLAGDQAGQVKKCSSTTGSMTYLCSMAPTLTAYTSGMVVEFVCATTALTGAATLNIDGLGAKSIKKSDGSTNPATGDCVAGQQVPLRYDGTVFRLPATGSGGGATTTVLTQHKLAAICRDGSNNPQITDISIDSLNSNTPALGCFAGTIGKPGYINTSDSATNEWVWQFRLPDNWDSTSSLDFITKAFTNDSTSAHVAVMTLETACDPTDFAGSYNATQSANITNGSTASTYHTVTGVFTGLTKTGCSAGGLLFVRQTRLGGNGSDDIVFFAIMSGTLRYTITL